MNLEAVTRAAAHAMHGDEGYLTWDGRDPTKKIYDRLGSTVVIAVDHDVRCAARRTLTPILRRGAAEVVFGVLRDELRGVASSS